MKALLILGLLTSDGTYSYMGTFPMARCHPQMSIKVDADMVPGYVRPKGKAYIIARCIYAQPLTTS